MSKFIDGEQKFSYQKIALGLINDNYLLDQSFGLRRSSSTTNFCLQRSNEVLVLPLIVDLGINVPMLDFFYDQKHRFVYVTKYLPDSQNFAQLKNKLEHLPTIAKLLRKFHKVDYQEAKIQKLSMCKHLNNFIKLSKYDFDDLVLNALLKKINAFLQEFDGNEKIILSHNDPIMTNFLQDKKGRGYLIDYEYSSLNTPYYDVAVFASDSGFIYHLDLLKQGLDYFTFNNFRQMKIIMHFMLYHELLFYFGSKCMILRVPNPLYLDFMKKYYQRAVDTKQILSEFN